MYYTELGLALAGARRIAAPLSAGLFLRYDVGLRTSARFDGFDAAGRTQVTDETGGTYTELWAGPLVRLSLRPFTAEVGYGAVGVRRDAGRADLPAADGSTDGAFRTHPSIAWLVALGGEIAVRDRLDIAAKLEYRLRYYDRRGGQPLQGDVHHGTQSIAPLVGLSWRF